MLVFSPNASALNLSFSDTHVVDTVTTDAPAHPDEVKDYVNFMIAQLGGPFLVHDFGNRKASRPSRAQ